MNGIMWPVWDYPALCPGREIAHPEPYCEKLGGALAGRGWFCPGPSLLLAASGLCVCFSPTLEVPLGLLVNCCPQFYLRNVFLPWRLAISLPPIVSVCKLRKESDVLELRVLAPAVKGFSALTSPPPICTHHPPQSVGSPEMEHGVFAGSLLDGLTLGHCDGTLSPTKLMLMSPPPPLFV